MQVGDRSHDIRDALRVVVGLVDLLDFVVRIEVEAPRERALALRTQRCFEAGDEHGRRAGLDQDGSRDFRSRAAVVPGRDERLDLAQTARRVLDGREEGGRLPPDERVAVDRLGRRDMDDGEVCVPRVGMAVGGLERGVGQDLAVLSVEGHERDAETGAEARDLGPDGIRKGLPSPELERREHGPRIPLIICWPRRACCTRRWGLTRPHRSSSASAPRAEAPGTTGRDRPGRS